MSKTIAEYRLGHLYTKVDVEDDESLVTVTTYLGDFPQTKVFNDSEQLQIREAIEHFDEQVRDIASRTSRSMIFDYMQFGGPSKEIYILWGYSFNNDWIVDMFDSLEKAEKAKEEHTAKIDPVEDNDRSYKVETRKVS